MKRILNTLLISAAALLSFSCQMKEMMNVTVNEAIVLDLSSGLTKADHSSTESFVNHLDVFIFESVSAAPAGKVYYGRYSVNNASSVVLNAKRSDFDQSKKYFVYLVANSTVEESEFASYASHNALLNKVQEDKNIHLSGLDIDAAPKYFLMDAVATDASNSTEVTLYNGNPVENTVLSAVLKRAAAKVVINIKAGDKVKFMPYTISEGSEGGLYYVRNLPYQTYVLSEAGNVENFDVRNTTKSDSDYFKWSPETDNKNVSLTVYVYPNSWSNASILEKETCVVMNLPLEFTDENGVVHQYHNSWYKVPMTDDSGFDRNNYYGVNINLNRPGAIAESTPVDIDEIFYNVTDWVPVSVNVGSGARPDYLQLNTDHIDIYNQNSDDSSLSFASSSPIPADGITLLEAYYYNYLDQKVNIKSNDKYNIYSKIKATAEQNVLNGTVTINSPFFSGNQEYHSNAIRYLKFRVTNSTGQTAEFTVAQYPTLYITNEHGLYSYRSDFAGTNYADGVGSSNISAANWENGSWSYASTASNNYFFGSKLAKSSQGSYTINYCYYETDKRGNVTQKTSAISGLDNPRMYHVHVTATSSKYIVAVPRLDADGYTESSPENTMLVSPSFMIASQLGATQSPSGGINQAKSHCEQYIEVTDDGKVYDDWRLPTAAEIDIIISHQDVSDAMAVVLSGPEYYCAYNTDTKGNVIYTKKTGKSGNQKAVRCIRDAY